MKDLKRAEEQIRAKMTQRGLRLDVLDYFLEQWREIVRGKTTEKICWDDIRPVSSDHVLQLPDFRDKERQRLYSLGMEVLGKCVIVKLNGGRSTTMGGAVPKCVVTAKNGLSFLDIIMKQIMVINDANGIEIPLVLMNSFFTDQVTERIVGKTPLMIMSFIQNEYPRIRMEDFFPLDTGGDNDWCPAGHGDFYMSFSGSGLLSELMDLGYRYVFISNIDNLCAEISPLILGLMKDKGLDFLMEVTRKTKADVKGGAPVFYKDRLTLLEIAQVPDEKMNDFQDIDKFSYFNTNNLWIDMKAMKKAIAERKLNLPVIKNQKKIANTDIIQVETAMGAALQSFERAGIVDVERVRFSPVKKMTDLLMLQSDIFLMDKDFRIIRNPDRPDALSILPSIKFHSGFMKENELSRHFEDPSTFSLINAESITIGGDVFFEKNVQVEGKVEISSTGCERLVVKEGTVLRGAL